MYNEKFLGIHCVSVIETQNRLIYVCNANGQINGTCISATGEGYSLEEAEQKAQAKLGEVVNNYKRQKPIGNEEYFISSQNKSSYNNSKANLNGGGNKRISEKQIYLLCKLASERETDIETVIMKKYRKQIGNLSGSEANELMQYFKSQV